MPQKLAAIVNGDWRRRKVNNKTITSLSFSLPNLQISEIDLCPLNSTPASSHL